VKPELVSSDRSNSAATWKNLFAAFETALRLLHPFMPFLTEELWHQLPQRAGARSIALDRFPIVDTKRFDEKAEDQLGFLQLIITTARLVRAESKISPKAMFNVYAGKLDKEHQDLLRNNLDSFKRMGHFGEIDFESRVIEHEGAVVRAPYGDVILQLQLDAVANPRGLQLTSAIGQHNVTGAVSTELAVAEVARLKKDSVRLAKLIEANQQRLEDQTFRTRAPEHIVKGLESTLAERQAEFAKVKERLAQLEKSLGSGS
jgi:valyl-tRNA synthetase